MAEAFGGVLKRLRLKAGYGMRRFALMIDMAPSNLSAMEHGRRPAPSDKDRVIDIASALGLVEGSEDWCALFDAAPRNGELPPDLQHMAGRKLVPVLLRTIDNRQLNDNEIATLIHEIQARHGGRPDDAG